jgi:cytoskeleton protein RodZ
MDNETRLTGAAKVGGELRAVRERLGWRLADVAAELRIRLPYLEAIERGELSALPGAAYQTGFVRTYSQALGLDGDEILRRFRAEGTQFVQKAELSFLAPVPDRAVPTGAIVLLGVVLVLLGYGLWYRHTEDQARLAAEIPSVPTELAPLAVPPKPPAAPQAAATPKPAAPASAPATNAAIAPSTPSPTTPSAAASATASAAPAAAAGAKPATQAPTQTAAAPVALPPPPAPVPAANIPATASPAAGTPAAAPPPIVTAAVPGAAPATKTIEATGDSWVQVKDPNGNVLFSKTLHSGDSWPVPDLPGLVMTAGNAGATMIAANGKPGSPLGPTGTVVRNYALTPPATAPAAPSSTN